MRYYDYYAWAWAPFLDDFLCLGWMVVETLDDRSGHPTFLVAWPCKCPVKFPRKGAYK